MIPYRIFFAALATLLILLGKFNDAKVDTYASKVYLTVLYAVAGYFWIASIFIVPTAWYARVLSVLGAIGAVVYCYITNFYKKETVAELKETNQFNTQDTDLPDEYKKLIGLNGYILYEEAEGYIGMLDGNGGTIFLYSDEKMKVQDRFEVTEIRNGKIFAKKTP
jgi:hypothetical protein